jgi:filamentous hemagglutinin family protein
MCKSFRFWRRSRYLSIVLILSLVFPPSILRADQYGADIVAGSAVINTQGSVMNINTQSDRTIINWQSFSIAQGNTTNFNQPSSSSAVLNRVTTPGNPSSILGTLNSNGNVYLVNPSGIFIGPSGVVNTNGFTASVFDISNKDFMAGGNLKFEGNSTSSVINQGSIYTGSGGIALLGH